MWTREDIFGHDNFMWWNCFIKTYQHFLGGEQLDQRNTINRNLEQKQNAVTIIQK